MQRNTPQTAIFQGAEAYEISTTFLRFWSTQNLRPTLRPKAVCSEVKVALQTQKVWPFPLEGRLTGSFVSPVRYQPLSPHVIALSRWQSYYATHSTLLSGGVNQSLCICVCFQLALVIGLSHFPFNFRFLNVPHCRCFRILAVSPADTMRIMLVPCSYVQLHCHDVAPVMLQAAVFVCLFGRPILHVCFAHFIFLFLQILICKNFPVGMMLCKPAFLCPTVFP